MDFNLPAIDTSSAEEGAIVPLKRIDGEPLLNAKGEPVTLTLIGSDSKTYRSLSRKAARRRVEMTRSMKGRKDLDDSTLDQMEAEDLDLIASCTTGWSGVLDSKDKPVPFSKEAALAFYRMFPIAKEQADRAIVDRSHFTKAS